MNSETKSHSETPLARLVRPVRRRDKSEARIINISLRIRKVCVVRRVERLRPKLQLHILRERERAVDAQVSLKETGTTQIIPPRGSKARAGLGRPRAIRGAVYSKHRVVEPWSSTWTTLRRSADAAESVDCRIELIRHLLAPAREQIRRSPLNYIERQSAHHTHYTAHLETTEDRTGPTFTRETLPFSER